MKKDVLIFFGGVSPEHEVSIITGLQVVEKIDRTQFNPYTIFCSKNGEMSVVDGLKTRKDFFKSRRYPVTFGRDEKGGFVMWGNYITKKVYPYASYFAFHGGAGEAGGVQGMHDFFGMPYTSTTTESSVIVMNKSLTKQTVSKAGVPVVDGLTFFASDIQSDAQKVTQQVASTLSLPVIIKPVHLGSSIGIRVAHSEIDLEKALIDSSYLDAEILVEKYIQKFSEYNCSVRLIKDTVEVSEIEKPVSSSQFLSFDEKYKKGSKKTGEGMASLQRELPAVISQELKSQIQQYAKKAFLACRCKGMVRIDFMVADDGAVYLTEINPIPGSMAFYLWEAKGITFQDQITDLLEQAVTDAQQKNSFAFDHATDIVEKFIAQ